MLKLFKPVLNHCDGLCLINFNPFAGRFIAKIWKRDDLWKAP